MVGHVETPIKPAPYVDPQNQEQMWEYFLLGYMANVFFNWTQKKRQLRKNIMSLEQRMKKEYRENERAERRRRREPRVHSERG